MKAQAFTYLLNLVVLASSFLATPLFAQQEQVEPNLKCHTSRNSLVIKIIDRELSFEIPIYELNKVKKRIPASMPTMTNSLKGSVLTQVAYHEGKRHKISISDIFNPEESSNALKIRSRQGHETTYPLKCSLINDQI